VNAQRRHLTWQTIDDEAVGGDLDRLGCDVGGIEEQCSFLVSWRDTPRREIATIAESLSDQMHPVPFGNLTDP
jgi:hypothetical protein